MIEVEPKRAIFIGRFQPFHKGHLNTITQMINNPEVDEVIIGIGSSQYHHYLGNPFTASERTEFIKRTLKNQIKYQIVEIPDIHDFPKWAPHVESLTPKFEVVYSGNTVVKDLFEGRGYEVRAPKRNFDISGAQIRNAFVTGEDWFDLVQAGTRHVLFEIDGERRVRKLHDKHTKADMTADLIVENENGEIALIDRLREPFKDMPALPGGYLEVGFETTIEAAIREAQEEISLSVSSDQVSYLGVYDNPGRDPRGHTVSHVYYTRVEGFTPEKGDDAKEVYWVKPEDFPSVMAFDHRKILNDYLSRKKVRL